MAVILLVHGMNATAESWMEVPSLLGRQADSVEAIQLPGHDRGAGLLDILRGASYTSGLSMDDYVAAVTAAFPPGAGRDVVLIGHSMGGAVISHVAASRPDRVAGLIYVAAMLPDDGQSPDDIVDWVAQSGHSGPEETAFDFLPHLARMRFVLQPEEPMAAPFTRTAALEALPRAYVRCTEDDVIPVEIQDAMLAAYAGTEIVSLARSHFPIFQDAPGLAKTLSSLSPA